jgi:tetratricopeptide (TPR) repeat protein
MKTMLSLILALAAWFPVRAGLAAEGGSARADGDAEQALEQATGAFALGQFSEAAEAYERAFRLHPEAALLYNAAQSHRLAGEKARALELYRNYVRVYRRGANRTEASRHIELLEKQLDDERARAAAMPAPIAPPAAANTPERPPLNLAAASPQPAPKTLPPAFLQTRPEATDVQRPLLGRPWFWVAVGGVALAAAGVIVGAALLSSPRKANASF